jgi:hypothetical protein
LLGSARGEGSSSSLSAGPGASDGAGLHWMEISLRHTVLDGDRLEGIKPSGGMEGQRVGDQQGSTGRRPGVPSER